MVATTEVLLELHGRIRECTACPLHVTRTQAVPGYGPVTARIMAVGEAPGSIFFAAATSSAAESSATPALNFLSCAKRYQSLARFSLWRWKDSLAFWTTTPSSRLPSPRSSPDLCVLPDLINLMSYQCLEEGTNSSSTY